MARPSVPNSGDHHPDSPTTNDTILAVHDDDVSGPYDSLDSAAAPPPREEDDDHAAAAGEPEAVRYRGWKTMPFVIGNETFEKLGSIGTAANLMVYLTSVFHMSNVRSAIALNAFAGTTNLATVFGAFASDLFLGRFSTVCLGSISTLIGMIILTLTAGVPSLHPPACGGEHGEQCVGATRGQFAVLVVSFLFIVVGAGGIRPCSLPFGADQFNPHTESGRRGINSFFNWYYFTLTIAVCGSSTGIIYVQSNVSWWIGFAIPAVLMSVSCVLFFSGAGLYVRVPPEGIPLAGVLRVTVAAFRKRHVAAAAAPEHDDPAASLFRTRHASKLVSRLPYTDQFTFLDKAAVVESSSSKDEVDDQGNAKDPWRLCSVQEVEEAKCVLRILPVWATCIVYYVSFAQTNTYVILQAAQSDRHVGSSFEVPPASFTIFPMLALTIWIPFYDRLMLPWLRRLTGREEGITLLQRMGVGMVLSVVAMLISGVAEQRRRELALSMASSHGVSPMSAFWLVPQLAALGLSEAFNQVSQMEFYYKQFPENMRSVAGSLLFSGLALSSYLSGLLVTVVHRTTVDADAGVDGWLAEDLNRGKLDWFYFLIGFIGAVNFFVFLACAKWYRYKGDDDGDDDDERDVDGIARWQRRSVRGGEDCPEEGRVVAN